MVSDVEVEFVQTKEKRKKKEIIFKWMKHIKKDWNKSKNKKQHMEEKQLQEIMAETKMGVS